MIDDMQTAAHALIVAPFVAIVVTIMVVAILASAYIDRSNRR